MLECFGMNRSKSVSIFLAAHLKLSTIFLPKIEKEVEHMSCNPYASIVGSLMYTIICTRLDISYDINVVSRYMGHHWKTY